MVTNENVLILPYSEALCPPPKQQQQQQKEDEKRHLLCFPFPQFHPLLVSIFLLLPLQLSSSPLCSFDSNHELKIVPKSFLDSFRVTTSGKINTLDIQKIGSR